MGQCTAVLDHLHNHHTDKVSVTRTVVTLKKAEENAIEQHTARVTVFTVTKEGYADTGDKTGYSNTYCVHKISSLPAEAEEERRAKTMISTLSFKAMTTF